MILFHNPESEVSRKLAAEMPEGVALVIFPDQFYSGPAPAELPSVLIDVPEYHEGEVIVPAHVELVRLPTSWQAVESYVAFVQARAYVAPE